jgi:hypothetical protein
VDILQHIERVFELAVSPAASAALGCWPFAGAPDSHSLLTAKPPELQPLIDHLGEAAQGRDDIRMDCAGTIAGSWFASGARRGEELVAAGLLMLAGHVDLDELDRWLRIGWERRPGAAVPYPDIEESA